MLALQAAPARAHGDAVVTGDPVTIAGGGEVTYELEAHYHRLIGRIDAAEPVSVELVRGGDVVFERDPASTIRIDHLIRCCVGTGWTDHTVRVVNPGTEPVRAQVSLVMVHDDLAVSVDGAEGGTRGSVVILSALLIVGLWRGRHRKEPLPGLRRPALIFGVVAGGIGVLTLLGWLRHGVGGAPAVLAGAMDVPLFPANPIVSRASLLLLIGILGWGLAAARWSRASASVLPWTAFGLTLVGAVIVVAIAVALAYGDPGYPALAATAAAVPVLGRVVLGPRTAAPTPG